MLQNEATEHPPPETQHAVGFAFYDVGKRTKPKNSRPRQTLASAAAPLVELGRDFHARGWVLGTSGNFSVVLGRNPLRLAITSSGRDKDGLAPEQILEVDARGARLRGSGKPSAETLLHLAIARTRKAGAVLHTHSVWSTILSEAFGSSAGLWIEGFEMLKGLDGVASHEHREWLPILENTQDIRALARSVEQLLAKHPAAHGLLLRHHGLYTWGHDLKQARRHVEVLEFLLEVVGREYCATRGLGNPRGDGKNWGAGGIHDHG